MDATQAENTNDGPSQPIDTADREKIYMMGQPADGCDPNKNHTHMMAARSADGLFSAASHTRRSKYKLQ